MRSPSVDAAAHERPSGAKRTLAARTASLVTRPTAATPRGAGAEPASSLSESRRRSDSSPASVRRFELST